MIKTVSNLPHQFGQVTCPLWSWEVIQKRELSLPALSTGVRTGVIPPVRDPQIWETGDPREMICTGLQGQGQLGVWNGPVRGPPQRSFDQPGLEAMN